MHFTRLTHLDISKFGGYLGCNVGIDEEVLPTGGLRRLIELNVAETGFRFARIKDEGHPGLTPSSKE